MNLYLVVVGKDWQSGYINSFWYRNIIEPVPLEENREKVGLFVLGGVGEGKWVVLSNIKVSLVLGGG